MRADKAGSSGNQYRLAFHIVQKYNILLIYINVDNQTQIYIDFFSMQIFNLLILFIINVLYMQFILG